VSHVDLLKQLTPHEFQHENVTRAIRPSFPVHDTGSQLWWGWLGLGLRPYTREMWVFWNRRQFGTPF